MSHRIFIVSDGTGETASQMTKAAMVQFSDQNVHFTRFKNIRTQDQIDSIIDDAEKLGAQIVFTMVSPQLRLYCAQKGRERKVSNVDLLGPLLVGMASHFGLQPKSVAGLLHDVNEDYFRRIEAVEYTVQHDDGKDLTGFDRADLIILGISRTSKTPLSMYLSHQGWKVANIPLIKGHLVPNEVFGADPRRVVGLTIDAPELSRIRMARLEKLGQKRGGDYADPENILEEIEYANEIFRQNRKWLVFNVTGKALEETATEIMRLMESRRLAPQMIGG